MKRIVLAAAIFLACTAMLRAAEVPIPPAPTRWATDTAGWLDPGTVATLDRALGNYERAKGHQVLLYVAPTTGDTPTEEWTIRAFTNWKVGRKGLDDGLVLFIFPQDKKVRVEVGYGLEGQVPDAIASRVIREVIVPKIQAGQKDGAAIAGIGALLSVIDTGRMPTGLGEDTGSEESGGGEGASGTGDFHSSSRELGQVISSLTLWQKIVIGLLILGFLWLLITHPGMALWLVFQILSGASGGRGGGGGGGGFSGGGGGGGGGGATGSW